MRLLFKSLFWLTLIAVVCAIVAVVVLAIESDPLVAGGKQLSPEDVERARAFLQENDPRHMESGSTRSLTVEERDLNLAADYLLSRWAQRWDPRAQFQVADALATVRVTLRVSAPPEASYLNAVLEFSDRGSPFRLERVRVGKLPVPGRLARPMAAMLHRMLLKQASYEELAGTAEAVQDLRFQPQRIDARVRFEPALMDTITRQGSELLLSKPEQRRLAAYQTALDGIVRNVQGRRLPLGPTLRRLFDIAHQRTTVDGEDAAAENQALIMALGLYASGRDFSDLLQTGAEFTVRPGRRPVRMTVHGRDDLAQHFLIAALLAVSVSATLADTFSVFKEMEDSRSGSGFSFTDLAADRAGVRLAEEATLRGAERARQLQRRLRDLGGDGDFMPSVKGLPEHLSESEFQAQFGDRHSAAYQELEAEIARRIDACPAYL